MANLQSNWLLNAMQECGNFRHGENEKKFAATLAKLKYCIVILRLYCGTRVSASTLSKVLKAFKELQAALKANKAQEAKAEKVEAALKRLECMTAIEATYYTPKGLSNNHSCATVTHNSSLGEVAQRERKAAEDTGLIVATKVTEMENLMVEAELQLHAISEAGSAAQRAVMRVTSELLEAKRYLSMIKQHSPAVERREIQALVVVEDK